MFAALPVALPKGYRIAGSSNDGQTVTVTVVTTRRCAECPSCHRRSRRVHSRYQRIIADLPGNGRAVLLRVRTRRFFCPRPSCSQRIFAERLTDLAAVAARRTDRLRGSLQEIGFAVGGRPGSRLAARLEMPASPSTLIRSICTEPVAQAVTPRVLGVDDYAFKRGHRFGTILVDLERRRTIDLLPDRSAESLEKWLKAHPGVEVIARDRAGAYAEGARAGAPNAVQVADRWHLIKNLGDALELLLGRHRRDLRSAVAEPLDETPPADESQLRDAQTGGSSAHTAVPAGNPERTPTRAERDSAWRRARRVERYEQVRRLYEQGHSLRAIGRKMNLDRRTVRRFVEAECFPERAVRARRASVVDPYVPWILQRWKDGCHNAAQIYREIGDQGYRGGRSQVLRYIASFRNSGLETATNTRSDRPPSPRRAAWLFVRDAELLTEQQQTYLARLCALSDPLKRALDLARAFLVMIRKRESERLPAWLDEVSSSDITELRSLARSLRGDRSAVEAGLALPWSNGPTEGNVHRLKMIKRQMYGRAGFELLRRRVLHAG
jgi:transposase